MANPLYIIGSTTAPTDKTTPVNGDNIPLLDSADSSKLKKLSWTNAKATLKTYFDTLYQASGTYVTSVAGTAPVASSGGTTPTISMHVADSTHDGYLSSTDWSTFNGKQPPGTYVTSVTGTSPVASSGGTTPAISLASGYGDTQNPYASKTANYFLSAPNGSAGVPTFRAIVAADIPTLNQNTSGTAAGLSATLATTSGGTGLTSFTSGGVVYASSTSALTTGSGLVFDGTNLGIGVTPSAWSGGPAYEIKGGSFWANATSGAYLTQNAYYNGSSWIYKITNGAGYYLQGNGSHYWYSAASGSAGNPITFAQAMALDTSGNLTLNSGNLVIGTSGKGITSGNFSLGLGANGSTSAVTIDTSNNMTVAGNINSKSITKTSVASSASVDIFSVGGYAMPSAMLVDIYATTGSGGYSQSVYLISPVGYSGTKTYTPIDNNSYLGGSGGTAFALISTNGISNVLSIKNNDSVAATYYITITVLYGYTNITWL